MKIKTEKWCGYDIRFIEENVNEILDLIADCQIICNKGIDDGLLNLEMTDKLSKIANEIGGFKAAWKVVRKAFNMQDLRGGTRTEKMVFEIGKYYEHVRTGELLHILGKVNSTQYGDCLVGESTTNYNLLPIGTEESNAVGYVETTKQCWDKYWNKEEIK